MQDAAQEHTVRLLHDVYDKLKAAHPHASRRPSGLTLVDSVTSEADASGSGSWYDLDASQISMNAIILYVIILYSTWSHWLMHVLDEYLSRFDFHVINLYAVPLENLLFLWYPL